MTYTRCTCPLTKSETKGAAVHHGLCKVCYLEIMGLWLVVVCRACIVLDEMKKRRG